MVTEVDSFILCKGIYHDTFASTQIYMKILLQVASELLLESEKKYCKRFRTQNLSV